MQVEAARPVLGYLGWRVEERAVPVAVEDIQGEFLRTHIAKNGCCGERELLKLWAFTFTEYHRVVHLDMDSLVLRPLDELFGPAYDAYGGLFTYDWNMARNGRNPPVQGGFLVVKPNIQVFDELCNIVRKGDFRQGAGWAGTGAGAYWGGMTIQGLMAYYYSTVNKGGGKALNRCIYNNMVDNPRDVGGFGRGNCRDGNKTCEDCRLVDAEQISNVHFTICQKPWECFGGGDRPYSKLCTILHGKWFGVRRDLEENVWGTFSSAKYHGGFHSRTYHGFCSRPGRTGYAPMPITERLLALPDPRHKATTKKQGSH